MSKDYFFIFLTVGFKVYFNLKVILLFDDLKNSKGIVVHIIVICMPIYEDFQIKRKVFVLDSFNIKSKITIFFH